MKGVGYCLPSRFLRTLCFLGGLASLTGCGPMYQTEYIYTPPKSQTGNACVFQCENSKQQCQQIQEMRSEDCERRAEYDYQRCEDRIYDREGRDAKWYECSRESCTADVERCEATYRSCYQSCGGKVEAQTRCVSNCDQIPPPSQNNQPGYRPYGEAGR